MLKLSLPSYTTLVIFVETLDRLHVVQYNVYLNSIYFFAVLRPPLVGLILSDHRGSITEVKTKWK